MQETFFTSSVMMGFFNFIKEIGLLNFIAGGIAVMAFGYGYHQLHPNATVPRSKNWSGIGLILSRVVLGSILFVIGGLNGCLLYTSPSPRDRQKSRMPSSA